MQKFRLICTLLVIVMVFTLLTGCSLFVRNEGRYRAQTALEVGDVDINLQQIIEFFSNNVYYLIAYYGYNAQDAWDMYFPSYLKQSVAADYYAKNFDGALNDSLLAQQFVYGKYISDETIEYYIESVRLSILGAYSDATKEEFTDEGYTISDEADDGRADKITLEFLEGSFAKQELLDRYDIETMEKDLQGYKPQPEITVTADDGLKVGIDFAFTETDLENKELKALIDELVEKLNDSIELEDGQDAITAEDYIAAQTSGVKALNRELENNYYMTVEEYMMSRINLLLIQDLYYRYTCDVKYEAEIDEGIYEDLDEKLMNLINQTKESYAYSTAAYAKLITSLADTSYIYTVPESYTNEYGFIKNLLVSFNADQLAVLAEYKARYGTDHEQYKKKRNELVSELMTTYFGYDDLTDEEKEAFGETVEFNEDSETYKFDSNFTLDANGNVTGCWLSGELNAIAAMTNKKERDSAFIDLMFKFNEDAGQHNKVYDYVIRVTDPDISGVADTWVKEFADVARKLAIAGVPGSYGYCVTDYGVHIVYFTGYVTCDFMVEYNGNLVAYESLSNDVAAEWQAKVNFWKTAYNNQYGAGSAVYRMVNSYYSTAATKKLTEALNDLQKKYEDEGLIVYNYDLLNEFLGGYGVTVKEGD
ncbi:MAG: hypothetical protein PHX51_06175 [Clostridia bacterium]|nr:hypothetical protein [Clostridia bacterium]